MRIFVWHAMMVTQPCANDESRIVHTEGTKMSSHTSNRARRAAAAVVAAAVALSLGGCAGGAAPEDQSLLVWTWDGNVPQIAEAYQEEHPEVEIEVVNVGTGNDQYTALQNAIAAKSGAPDIAFLDATALPQFGIAGALADLGPLGADELADDFAPGPWAASQLNGRTLGLPWASGPMVMFYNQAVFDRLGVQVPTTWSEYLTAAEQLHAADPEVYILNDSGNAGLATSLIWQAGGTPFEVDDAEVSIDLADAGTTRYSENWQKLIDADLLAPVADWSDDWVKMLGAGRIATLPAGSWMGSALMGSVPDSAGQWRVAQLPQWEAGEQVAAEHGGGGFSVLESSSQKELAYDFLEYTTKGAGVDIIKENGLWPAYRPATESTAFLDEPNDYFGGQKVNQEYATASASVPGDFEFLPYQVYANGVFNDSVGKAYTKDISLEEGLLEWQASLDEYGARQGFTVEK